MSNLSISRAWEETRHVLAHDGRLLGTVALALFALPAAIMGAVIPGGLGAAMFAALQGKSLSAAVLLVVLLLVMLVGQLSITRLTIGPSVSVGGSIAHAVRRLPVYVGVGLIVGIALMAALMVIAIVVGVAAGPGASEEQLASSPGMLLAVMAMVAVYLFLLARIISMAAAVTSSERHGVFGVLRRSWSLTSGSFWRLFGFLLVFFIGAGVLLVAIGSVVGVVVQLMLGTLEPMAASTLVLALVDGAVSGAVSLLLVVMLARIYVQLAGPQAQASVPSSGI